MAALNWVGSGTRSRLILILTMMVALFGAAPGQANQNWRPERDHKSHGSRPRVRRPRAPNRNGLVRDLCAELLTKPELMTSVDVQGAPGLRILSHEIAGVRPDYDTLLNIDTDSFHPHELVSSARYAKVINATKGETVLMVPGIEHKSIPGFDGVIFNAQDRPVANYSLKTLLTAHGQTAPMERAHRGVEQAKKFSFVERWFVSFDLLFRDESGAFRVSKSLSKFEAHDLKKWLSKSLKLFGLKSPHEGKRPTRVVVDIQSDAPMPAPEDVEQMRGWIRGSRGLIESIVFLKGDDVLEVR